MTLTQEAAPSRTASTASTAGSYGSLGPTRSAVVARVRGIVPWLVILLLGSLALVALGARSAAEARLLDPRSPAPVGTRALAQVLAGNGVEVSIIESMAQLPTAVRSGTTVVVTADEQLSPSALRQLAQRSLDADRLVVLLAEPGPVGVLAPTLQGYPAPTGFPISSAPASRCEIPGVTAGDLVVGASVLMLSGADAAGPDSAGSDSAGSDTAGSDTAGSDTAGSDTAGSDSGVTTCLPSRELADGGALLAQLPAGEAHPQTLLVGFAAGLTNESITSEDNAAIALRLLGHSRELVWLIPSGVDAPGAAGGTYSPWPTWTTPVAATLALGTVLLALVRGRRLGRVVHEPLPVVVRAAETTESRGHLYRRSRDRERTAAILRDGTRSRLRHRLGVARGEPLQTLVAAVARSTGEPVERIHALLADSAPASTAALITLGAELAELEGKVRL